MYPSQVLRGGTGHAIHTKSVCQFAIASTRQGTVCRHQLTIEPF